MNISRVDLNLLVYLDVLLRECNVTRAAEQLGLSQPAMSNGLRRLRELFGDPLLVRISDGMAPTERAQELQPLVREALACMEKAVQARDQFNTAKAKRVFRIMVSDYTESTLIPGLLERLLTDAPGVVLDIMTPSDMAFADVERGRADLVINRFDNMPQSFHQVTLWRESYSCLMRVDNPLTKNFSLDGYLSAQHIWVSKTGMGVGTGINPGDVQRLGWVDLALSRLGHKRKIKVFTRHYQAAMLLARNNNLIVTVPSKAAQLHAHDPHMVALDPPFPIPPFELKMAWTPLLHHDSGHQWLRRLILEVAQQIDSENADLQAAI